MKVAFVCTGNTCRSPMLAAMFADYAAKVGFECEVASAGTDAKGEPVSAEAARVLAARGLSAGNRVSRLFDATDAQSDVVFTMTDAQRDLLAMRYPGMRVTSLSEFCGADVEDPYGKEGGAYDALADLFEGMLAPIHDSIVFLKREKGGDAPSPTV